MPLRFAETTSEAYRYPLLIRHLPEASLRRAQDQEIVYQDRLRLSYPQLSERIGRLASLLSNLETEAGTTVAVMDWDSHRYLEAYFAVPMMGAVLQTVNVRLPVSQMAYTLRHAEAEVLLVHRDFYPLIEQMLPDLPRIRAVVAIDDGADGPLPAFAIGEYEQLSAAASPDYEFREFDEDALATTVYTTGTTGKPKGVCFNRSPGPRRNRTVRRHELPWLRDRRRLHAVDADVPRTRLGRAVHRHHARGEAGVSRPLRPRCDSGSARTRGGLLPALRAHYPADGPVRRRGEKQRPLGLGGEDRRVRADYVALAPGAAAGNDTDRRLRNVRDGSTISVARPHRGTEGDLEAEAAALTMTDVPVPLVHAKIVDAKMEELPWDGVARGELVLRAPWLTQCYTSDVDASKELWRGGWMHTQDVATIDADGTIMIRDRLKDVIKTGGEWVGSLEIEELVASSPAVDEVAVVGAPDDRWGERPVAFVVPNVGPTPLLEDLNIIIREAVARGVISRYATLDRLELVTALPRTSVGKIDKKLLRSSFPASGKPPHSASATSEPAD